MPLQTHPLKITIKLGKVGVDGQACLARLLPVTHQPVYLLFFLPLNIGISEQRYRIVSDRADDRILKIDDAGAVLVQHHEVARMIITMDVNLRLRQIICNEQGKGAFEHVMFCRTQIETQMFAAIPLVKQFHFTFQQLGAVGRQSPGLGGALQLYQRLQRLAV